MRRLTLIYAAMGRKPGKPFVRSWQMQPLAIGRLAALTPKSWQVTFFDDRVEDIDYEVKTDLVGIAVETYSAKRAYEIAARFRQRGIPVIFGGYHATLCAEEVLEHGNAVCIGEAESVWQEILQDAEQGSLKRIYKGDRSKPLDGVYPARSIFDGKNYMPLALVETSRGCPFRCKFCSISAAFEGSYRRRPVQDVVEELKSIPQKNVFFVDDNIVGSSASARELFDAIAPLGIKWVSQASLHALKDDDLVEHMACSGCLGVLVGFESLNPKNLAAMGKGNNRIEEYRSILKRLRKAGIFVYGTFIFGYPHDTPESFEESIRFAMEEKLFLAAFNNLVPFPGTLLYQEIEAEGRLKHDRWWLSGEFEFGQVPFNPQSMEASEIEKRCHNARERFYSWGAIFKRGLNLSGEGRSYAGSWLYWSLNLLLRRERRQKFGIRLAGR